MSDHDFLIQLQKELEENIDKMNKLILSDRTDNGYWGWTNQKVAFKKVKERVDEWLEK